jgi:hypothetical protein
MPMDAVIEDRESPKPEDSPECARLSHSTSNPSLMMNLHQPHLSQMGIQKTEINRDNNADMIQNHAMLSNASALGSSRSSVSAMPPYGKLTFLLEHRMLEFCVLRQYGTVNLSAAFQKRPDAAIHNTHIRSSSFLHFSNGLIVQRRLFGKPALSKHRFGSKSLGRTSI